MEEPVSSPPDWPPFGPGIYLHIPFCVHRCGYCDFFTRVSRSPARESFVEDLLGEIRLAADGSFFRTVFFGGGTPSLLSGPEMARILDALRAAFRLSPDCEVTVECNPESITPEKMAAYRRAGVNRISLGVQSMNPEELRVLERAHGATEVEERVGRLRREGFENISLDLIYGLPGSTLSTWEDTLRRALALRPEHLSAYLLSLEPTVPMAGRYPLPDGDAAREQYELLRKLTGAAGLVQYEISNFALPGRKCRHNQNYWVRGEYLGLGPSAHSHAAGRRLANPNSMTEYGERIRRGQLPGRVLEQVDSPAAAAEWIFLGLRRMDGISWSTLLETAGPDRGEALRGKVERMMRGNFLDLAGDRLRLLPEGYFLSNSIFTELMEAL